MPSAKAAAPHVLLTGLSLLNFRCHRQVRITFEKAATWLIGPNGAGKTSLIEAIHYLGRLKSHLTASTKDLIHHTEEHFTIQGELADGNKIRIIKSATNRELFFNQTKTDIGEFYGQLPVVIFSSEDTDIIRSGGATRRAYLNALLAHTSRPRIAEMLRYNRILLQRSAELRKPGPDMRTLHALTSQLIASGQPLQCARAELAGTVASYAAVFHKHISGSREKLKIKIYPASWQSDIGSEIKQQRNLIGWQRDTVEIYINGKPASKFASEGQQRTAALALRCAEYIILRRHSQHPPLLLVDDVLGELDTARRKALTELLDTDCQIIIASTDLDHDACLRHKELPAVIRLGETIAKSVQSGDTPD